MGFVNFLKRTAKKIGSGIATGGKWLGEHAKPAIHSVSNIVEKLAPYASGALNALGQTSLAGVADKIGKYAGIAKAFTAPPPKPTPQMGSRPPG